LLIEINEELEKKGKKMIVFIDEAQVLKQAGFDRFLAFIYDRLRNFKVVLAGSEVGLLDELIGAESGAPLYGRARKVIEIKRLDYNKSIEFLKKGFLQIKKKRSEDELKEVVEKLDGIIGWLAMYGFYSIEKEHTEALRKTITEGAKIVASEIEKFLSNREIARKKYLSILSFLAARPLRWTEIKYSFATMGETVPESRLLQYLDALQEYGFVEKTNAHYKLADPLIVEALPLLTGRK
jgi:AAA+ ATPase superfamily predicted ATPase